MTRALTVGQLIEKLSMMPTGDEVVMDVDPMSYTAVTSVELHPAAAARIVVLR
jgi:hypothetical protein